MIDDNVVGGERRIAGALLLKERSAARRAVLLVVGLIVLSSVPLLLSTDLWTQIPNRDSGVFLYIGSRILHGEIPYRDIWDHKGPAIFYIDALGIALGSGTQLGVQLLEWLSLFIAVLLGYDAMRRLWGTLPAFFGSLAWVFTLPILFDGGNLTEEYALPLQFGALWLFSTCEELDAGLFRWFGIGMLGGGALLLRQNLTGLWISIAITILIRAMLHRHWGIALKRVLFMALGVMVPVGGTLFYFGQQNALAELWDNYVLYNFAYSSGATTGARLTVIVIGMLVASMSGLFLLAAAGWVTLVVRRARSYRSTSQPANIRPDLALLLAIALPVEITLSSISGSIFTHYYVAWLPVSAMLTAYLIYVVMQWRRDSVRVHSFSNRFLLMALVVILCLGPLLLSLKNISQATGTPDIRQQVSRYIVESTHETDSVLMWGASASVNYLSDRRSPTRYAYQLPLYNREYSTPAIVDAFREEIITNKPLLIVDASQDVGYVQNVPPISATGSNKWISDGNIYVPDEINEMLNYISKNYCLVAVIGTEKWSVYRLCADR